MSKKARPAPPPLSGDPLARQYDEVPYPAHAFPFTHPGRLGAIGTINGMRPASPGRCRVLELGCGDGANLVPMALASPGSEFAGVDIAGEPIARGQALIAELGLTNLRLEQADIRAVDASYGAFDYIIAHGVYAWVPPDVQDRLIGVCGERLAPHGIAYVSYNAMPGGHIRRMLREMLFFHVRGIPDPLEQAREAKEFLGFLARGSRASGPDSAYANMMAVEADRARQKRDADVYHDDLAAINEPVYFMQLVEHGAAHGLQYLGEADHFDTEPARYGDDIAATLQEIEEQSVLLKEQYLDFLECRLFRKTLLCRADLPLQRAFDPNTLTPLFVSSGAAPVETPAGEKGETFRSELFGSVTLKDPMLAAAMRALHRAGPEAIQFPRLVDVALLSAGPEPPSKYKATLKVAEFVHRSYRAGLVELHTRAPHFVGTPADRPIASALVRLQARTSDEATSLRHEFVRLDGLKRPLVVLLDGSRDRGQLAAELTAGGHAGGDAASLPERIAAALVELGREGVLLA